MAMHKRLGFQINIVVMGVLSILLLATLLVLNSGVRSLTAATGRQRVEQEADVVQQQLAETWHDALTSAHLFAAIPDLVDMVGNRDATRLRTAALVNSARYGFSRVRIVDATGQQLVSTTAVSPEQIAQEDTLLERAGLEIDTNAISAQDQSPLVLIVSVPIHNQLGQRIGALVASRTLDSAFLDSINIAKKSSDLLLIHAGQVQTQSTPNQARLAVGAADLSRVLNPVSISQALAGQVVLSDDLIQIADAPYALAYVALGTQNQPSGVIAILVDVSELVTFQNQLITRLTVVFTLLALGAIILTTFFVYRRVVAPLGRLQSVAEQMVRGDYAQPALVTTQDEIGQLGRAFNTMTTAVQERETALQQLTVSLEQRSVEVEHTLAELRESISERDELSLAIRELASPVLPVMRGVLVMPLIGVIDSERVANLTQALLIAIERHLASIVILDITGVPIIDTQVARALLQVADTARLLGTQTVLVGLRPELAQTIVGLGLNLTSLNTQADLQSGITYAIRQQSR